MAKTFAQQAKTITNRYKLRLGDKFDKGDPLALAAMNQELGALQQEQESVRETELGATPQVAPQFANGGNLPMHGGFDFSQFLNNKGIQSITSEQTGFTPDMIPGPSVGTGGIGEIGGGFQSRVPWMGAAAGAIGGLLANKKLDLPEYNYEEYEPTQARANLVDYSRGREQTMRERDQANAVIARNARGTGSQASLMENILAGTTGTQRAAGSAFNQSLEQEGNVNAQIKNQTSQFNAAQQTQAAQMNTRNQLYANQLDRENVLFNDQRRQNRIGAVTGAAQGYTKDRLASNQYDQMINMMAPDNYSVQASKDSLFRRIFQISPDMKIDFRNTDDKANTKQYG